MNLPGAFWTSAAWAAEPWGRWCYLGAAIVAGLPILKTCGVSLVSWRISVEVLVDGVAIPFEAGESILTECSYKYTPASFAALAQAAGMAVEHLWTDPRGLFSVQYLVAR